MDGGWGCDGHPPTDSGVYHMGGAIDDARAALTALRAARKKGAE